MYKPIPNLTPKQLARFVGKIKIGDCWEWQAAQTDEGYGRISIGRVKLKAHRVAYRLFHGDDPGELFVCHKCDNARCVRPDHLFLGTNADNMRDSRDKGRSNPPTIRLGSTNPQAKLTEESARAIKCSSESNITLARRHGISDMVVSLIKRGKRWKHV